MIFFGMFTLALLVGWDLAGRHFSLQRERLALESGQDRGGQVPKELVEAWAEAGDGLVNEKEDPA